MALIYNATFDKNTRKLSFEDKAGNEIYSFTVPERAPAVDDITKPLTFKATQGGSTVSLKKNGSPSGDFQTSRDGGNTWEDYSLGTAITLNTSDEVSFRAKADRTSDQSNSNYFYFQMNGKIEAWHNVMSLYRTNDFSTYDTTVRNAFRRLFYSCVSLTKAPVLPATTLANDCYYSMFWGCTSLAEAPALPATTLADSCYQFMFYNCASLTKAPALPVTALANDCYSYMFQRCTSLTKAPELPATTLADYCYNGMFKGCTSLTKAPVLPVTTLANSCYNSMFSGCTSLSEAPVLPATTLSEACYGYMFSGCTSLSEAPELPATTLDTYCYQEMFRDCTSLTKAPALPATTLANYCYYGMFKGCTSLTKAPDLSATTLAQDCYNQMFYGCSSLNEVRCQMPSSYSSSQISSYAEDWLYNVASTGTFHTNADANWPMGSASGIPEGWTRVNEGAPAVDDLTKPLTLKATQGGSTVKLAKRNSPTGEFQTSTDGGNTWTDYTIGTAITLNIGDEVSFRAKADRTTEQDDLNYFYFQMNGKIEAWHNVMSLYRTNDFSTYNTVLGFSFYNMFNGCTSLTKAPALSATTLSEACYGYMFDGCTSLTKAPVLPATTLADSCYYYMFSGCTSLSEAPELPATALVLQCYSYMFKGCTSLTKAPALPVTTLVDYCYSNMFKGCTSLVNAPRLPATTLAQNCYSDMFQGCTSLKKAPELPATALVTRCYQFMFNGCTSLTKAPDLPATALANYCYQSMFNGCTSLNEVRCEIPSTISAENVPTYTGSGTYAWLKGVSSTGTFYTNTDANWPSGASGIPTGWTRVPEVAPAVDNIRKPLTFRATQDGSTVKLTKNGTVNGAFKTSRDGGNTWTDYTLGTYITLNTGDEVSFRASADRTSGQTVEDYFGFQMTGKIEAWHNVMSMYRKDDFATYSHMVSYAFNSMFNSCTSLTKAPKLPVTTLAHGCYRNMFAGCTSLTKAPELPATTLAVACYWCMFDGCTSLTKAPELTATTLASSCYQYMFDGCTSLTKTPALSATTLAEDCYQEMFRNCSSLNEVRCKIPSSYSSSTIPSYATYWLSGVSSKGTFYTNADANWPSGDDGIPQTWTRANIDDYPTT